MSDHSLFRFPRLKGSQNWEFWALRMEAFIIDKGYETALYPVTPFDATTTTEEAYKVYLIDRESKSHKAAALIRLSVEDGPLIQIKGLKDAISIWDTLKDLYEPKGFSSEFLICKELFSTTLARCGNSIEKYLTRIKRLSDELASRNLTIPTKVLVAYALNNLSQEYEHTVAIITQSLRASTDKEIELNSIFSYLIDEARRLKSLEPQEMAMNTTSSTQNKPKCTYCEKKGHTEEKCWKKNPQLKPKKPNKAKKAGNDQKTQETTLITQDQSQLAEEEELAFTTSVDLDKNTWLLDSGTTRHICAFKELFSELRPYNTVLNWGKAIKIPVKWIGTVRLNFQSNSRAILRDCLFVPEMGINLLSQGLLRQKGVSINIGLQSTSLNIDGKEIAEGFYRKNLTLISTIPQENAYISTTISDGDSWHQRMGHIGATALRALPEKTLGCDLDPKKVEKGLKCDICIQAKATKKVSRVEMPRASTILEKVHSDICGPITPETLSKRRYFVSFIDDKTRWATVKLLTSRDQVLTAFTDYLIEEERQLGTTLKRLHSDNAKEYKSEEFKGQLAQKGIISTYSAPYSPEQNGVSERFNRTIINKVRAMLISSGVGKALWGEAVQAATYIYNRTPNSSLISFISPFEARTGKKPDISTIRTFGSIAYKREPKELLKKLDPRASPYIIVGYGSNQYRLIKPGGRLITTARDIDILEGTFLKDLLGGLETRITRLGTQLKAISKEQLETSQDQSENDEIPKMDLEVNWLEKGEGSNPNTSTSSDLSEEPENNWFRSFYKELEEHSTETALLTTDPTYKEAITSEDSIKWKKACQKEVTILQEKGTWTLVPRTSDLKVLDGKWVLKIKDPHRKPLYKARWVARGFQQQYGIDFFETFANTVNTTAWRLLLAIAGYLDWNIRQWDVKSAFPNASLRERVYIQQPTGFEDPKYPNWVCQLNKALYGLKQSAREWELHLKNLLEEAGLFPLKTDQSIYLNTAEYLILIAYIDDFIIISPKLSSIQSLYDQLAQRVELKDLGDIDEFLGIKITRNRQNKAISLNQGYYIEKILAKFGYKDKRVPIIGCPIPIGAKIEPLEGIADPKDVKAYQQAIGALMYLNTKTRPDLAFPIGYLARYMANPGPTHFRLLDKVWKYLEQRPNLGLYYQSDSTTIEGYVDSDWGGDIGTRRSTTGYIFLFLGSPISWSSKLQKTVALSSCEAEYMALREAIKEQQYIKALLSEITPILGGQIAIECQDIYTDSNSAIELAKNPIYHARTKHVDIQYHYVRECIQNEATKLKWTSTNTQLADGLTKAISRWTQFIEGIGLRKGITALDRTTIDDGGPEHLRH